MYVVLDLCVTTIKALSRCHITTHSLAFPNNARDEYKGLHEMKMNALMMGITVEIIGLRLLSLHASLDLTQLAFSSKQFLSFLVDLSLHLDFNLSKLLFFASELLFLETNRLACEIFRVDGGVLSTAK